MALAEAGHSSYCSIDYGHLIKCRCRIELMHPINGLLRRAIPCLVEVIVPHILIPMASPLVRIVEFQERGYDVHEDPVNIDSYSQRTTVYLLLSPSLKNPFAGFWI